MNAGGRGPVTARRRIAGKIDPQVRQPDDFVDSIAANTSNLADTAGVNDGYRRPQIANIGAKGFAAGLVAVVIIRNP